jgi:rubrerythrin
MKTRDVLLLFLVLLGCVPARTSFGQTARPETVAVMKEVLTRELLAHARYVAISLKAREEGYPRIAYLADALSTSEGVHARNCLTILSDLGNPSDEKAPDVPMADTKTNLKNASTAELDEIDVRYPKYLARIKPENYPAAIDDLTHAWQAEKQHRDLIAQILSGTGIFFGLMVKKFEENPVDYFVCDNCGSTLIEMPKEKCPICGGPSSRYRKVQPVG